MILQDRKQHLHLGLFGIVGHHDKPSVVHQMCQEQTTNLRPLNIGYEHPCAVSVCSLFGDKSDRKEAKIITSYT